MAPAALLPGFGYQREIAIPRAVVVPDVVVRVLFDSAHLEVETSALRNRCGDLLHNARRHCLNYWGRRLAILGIHISTHLFEGGVVNLADPLTRTSVRSADRLESQPLKKMHLKNLALDFGKGFRCLIHQLQHVGSFSCLEGIL